MLSNCLAKCCLWCGLWWFVSVTLCIWYWNCLASLLPLGEMLLFAYNAAVPSLWFYVLVWLFLPHAFLFLSRSAMPLYAITQFAPGPRPTHHQVMYAHVRPALFSHIVCSSVSQTNITHPSWSLFHTSEGVWGEYARLSACVTGYSVWCTCHQHACLFVSNGI